MRSRQSAGSKDAGGGGIGGQFKAREYSEPGFSLEGLQPHQGPQATAMDPAVIRRSRDQGMAAASLLAAYPDIVAARFVDIGSKDLVAPNGMTMPNPDYDPQPGVYPESFRRFELRSVLLADGSIADDDNQPRFTSDPSVEKLAENFQDHADLVFDPPGFDETYTAELYKDHVNNQHVYFNQMIKDMKPRRLEVDEFGTYRDLDLRGQAVGDPTDAEKEALGDRTPKAAINEYAAKLIKQNGKKRALAMMQRDALSKPDPEKPYGKVAKAIEKLPDRKLWGIF